MIQTVEITASYDQLMKDAMFSVVDYMARSAQALDAEFGEGYAKKNPALVATMIASMAAEFAGSSRSKVMQGLTEQWVEAINGLADALERPAA